MSLWLKLKSSLKSSNSVQVHLKFIEEDNFVIHTFNVQKVQFLQSLVCVENYGCLGLFSIKEIVRFPNREQFTSRIIVLFFLFIFHSN